MNILETYTNEEVVAYLLRTLGVQPHLKGWRYLNSAVAITLEDSSVVDHACLLYEKLAIKHGTTIGGIERGIRHAIEAAFEQSSYDSWLWKIFTPVLNPIKAKPCNALFIATCAALITSERHCPIFILEEPAV